MGEQLVREHVRRWAEELVDLSRRNRLLYFKHTASASLEFAQPAAEVVDRLPRGWTFHLPPPPPPADPDDPATSLHEPPPAAPAPVPADDELVVAMTPERHGPQIERGLKNLAAKAQAEFLDAGLWVLYLGLGHLQWVDIDGRPASSPLLLVPVGLSKTTSSGRWRLTASTDGEPALNPALAVKLERDFGIRLPTLDDLPEPELADVLAAVRAATTDTGWTVDETAVLSTFTFQKEVIYRDLRDNEDVIIGHDMVRLLAEGPSSSVAVDLDFAPEPDETLDDRHPPEDLAFVLDADATQRQCLIAARAGRSFVMDGPPGTGKSQTITNVIAQLIADGKTVLFVSEKAAALEVVQKRLAELSLDPFVLPLHSHTATRKAVAQELGRALQERPTARHRFDAADRAQLERSRRKLTEYASAVNDLRHPLGRSLHDAVGRAAQLDHLPALPTPEVEVSDLGAAELSSLLDAADQLGRAWGPVERGDDFVWRHLRPDRPDTGGEADLRHRVVRTRATMAALQLAAATIAEELRLPEVAGPADALDLLDLLDLIEWRSPVGAAWLASATPDDASDAVAVLADRVRTRDELAAALDGTAGGWATLPPDGAAPLADLEAALAAGSPAAALPDGFAAGDLATLATALDDAVAALEAMRRPVGVLAGAFGVAGEASLDQAHRLAELGQLVGSPTAPEPEWLNPVVVEAIGEARRVLADLVADYRTRRDALRTVFTEGVLDLDLPALRARFADVHTGLHKLSGAYRADKRTLAAVTVSGKVTDEVLARLDDAIAWQQLSTRLTSAEQRHGPRLGDRYYASRHDADLDEIERAVGVADRALALAGADVGTAHLAGQLGLGATPDPAVPAASRDTFAAMEGLRAQVPMLERVVPLGSLGALPLGEGIAWCQRVAVTVREIAVHLRTAETAGLAAAGLGTTRALLADRAAHAAVEAEVATRTAAVADLLGTLADDPSPADLDAAVRWVREVHAHVGGPVRAATAPLLLRTARTSSDLRDPVQSFDKAAAELVGLFLEPWSEELRRDLAGSFAAGGELLGLLADTVSDAAVWESHVEARSALARAGWAPVVEACEEQRVPAEAVRGLVERSILRRWADQVVGADDRLTPRRAVDRDVLQRRFADLDTALVRDAAAGIINACVERRPRSLAGGAGIINQQAQLKRRHKPVRKLLAEAGDAAQRLKPCFMMSPLSVSQFLPPGLRFDVVIFDEASQVREADAVCCVYRGDQLVVAGDPKQLPPTSFFAKNLDPDDDEADEEHLDFESILDRCKAQGFPALPLNWHYRSRHESLITFSNRSFYDGRLHTFPGATFEAPALGVELFRVDGEYRRGTTRDNLIEAEAVVDRIVFHRTTHPELTLGVVTLSAAQQACIESVIERRSADEPVLQGLRTDDRLGGFFVKNLENVQGDERDVILLSVGYGPDETGKVWMNFGPMSRAGGERRLNVAVTRAKSRVEVVSSITADQIVGGNPTTRHLARYLDYAERGAEALTAAEADGAGRPADADADADAGQPFTDEVQRSVEALGYDVVARVGAAGYRIDLGVHHPAEPGTYALGVECDGPAYHSSKVARDRDRLRRSVLEGLGWRIHRIWSTAWFLDRPGEEMRLRLAIEAAVRGDAPPAGESPEAHGGVEVVVEEADFAAHPDWAHVYEQPVVGSAFGHAEFVDPASRSQIASQILEAVVECGPIHTDHVLAALKDAWGFGRAGERIRAAYAAAIALLQTRGEVELSGGFLTVPGQEVVVRVPEDATAVPRKVGQVAPAELQLALVQLLDDAGASPPDNLRAAWARLFGWKRIGPDIEIAFDDAVDALRDAGTIDGADPLRLA